MKTKPSRSSQPPLVRLRNAGVERSGRWLVRHIDLDIVRGEIITLIGPNGSGKSTTAKMVLDIVQPSEGKMTRQAGLTIGYVPQKLDIDHALPLSIARLMELTGPVDRRSVDKALDEVDMLPMRHAEVSTLSGGELQRVLLARASARKPDLLVLDEPLQGVDFSGEKALYELIGSYRKQLNCGILLISHDLHIVMAESDRVLCLNGHICCSGKPQDVVGSQEFAALFGSRENHMLSVYQHHHDHSHTADGSLCRAGKTKSGKGKHGPI